MSERAKAFWHNVYHFWMGSSTYSVTTNGERGWGGMVCDCGKSFGYGAELKALTKNLFGRE
jgi:hypothetical protein